MICLIPVVLNYEEDVAMYIVKAANDPRTCNRVVSCRPLKNIITQNKLISLWHQKSGQTFTNTFVSEEQIVKLSQSKTIYFVHLYQILYFIKFIQIFLFAFCLTITPFFTKNK